MIIDFSTLGSGDGKQTDLCGECKYYEDVDDYRANILKQSQMLDNKKGSWCSYLQSTCQEGDCSRCETYLRRNDMLPEGAQ